MAIPNPNPNIADGIKSDNKTYSSNKIESLIKTATELPIPEAGDAGKVLTVNSDENGYELDTPVTEDDITSAVTSAVSDKISYKRENLEANGSVTSPKYNNMCIAFVGRQRAACFIGGPDDVQTLVSNSALSATFAVDTDGASITIASTATATSVVTFLYY